MNSHMMGKRETNLQDHWRNWTNWTLPKEHGQKVKLSGYAEKIREE